MNKNHELCGSDEWRAMIRETILPWAMGEVDLGDDVLEVGPGYGATTDVLGEVAAKLTAVEIDDELVALLTERYRRTPAVVIVQGDATALQFPDDHFSGAVSFTMLHHVPTMQLQNQLFTEVCRVLRPGASFVLGDSMAGDDLAAMHDGDTYNPVDPEQLPSRLETAGFLNVEVKRNPFGWAALGRKP